MTIVVYSAGQGDLRNDIVGLSGCERKNAQEEAQKKADDLLTAKDAEGLLALLLEPPADDSRFSAPPLSLILHALSPAEHEPERAVKVLLLASRSGNPKTQTWGIGRLLKNALGLEGVRDEIRRQRRLDVEVEMLEANLMEAVGIKRLTERLSLLAASQPPLGDEPGVVVNAISGATMVALGAMGAADQLGLDWRAAVAPGAGTDKAVLLDRSSYETAPFHWLRSLGYVEQARTWAEERRPELLDDDSFRSVCDLMELVATDPAGLEDDDLARLLALDMARADNGAGLVARAWVQKHYLTLHAEEIEAGKHTLDDLETVAKGGRNRSPMLGHIIKAAEEHQRDLGNNCPPSALWLLEHKWLNDVGKTTVHDLAAPSASDVRRTLSLSELSTALPDWVARPGRGSVLFVVPCGTGAPRGMPVTERVLGKEPDKEIRRAIPGAMLDGAKPLEAEFLFLHSADPRSKKRALDEDAASSKTQVDAGWEGPPVLVNLCDYGGGSQSEYVATPSIMETVNGQVALALKAKRPAGVVIVGTGQKAAVLGALQAAQQWCAEHATPLFLQTFVDKESEGSVPQLHRLALHNDAEAALRQAALSSLRSLNLLSAVRVLAAGDRDMDSLADQCDALRQQLLEAANDEEDPDRCAGVLIDLLQTVADLWKRASESEKMRLAVVVAEAANFNPHGQCLLTRNKKLGGGQAVGIQLRRPCPEDCGERNARDKGAHRDLLQILYEVRNRLVVTHGTNCVEDSLRSVLEMPKNVAAEISPYFTDVDGITYAELLRLTCDKLSEAAKVLEIDLHSTWAQDFKKLQKKIETGQVEETPQ